MEKRIKPDTPQVTKCTQPRWCMEGASAFCLIAGAPGVPPSAWHRAAVYQGVEPKALG